MLKANEIRLGNYYDHNGEYRQVTPSVIEEVWNAERTWCKPIPLTEELLLKMGFKYIGGEGYALDNGFSIYSSLRNGWMAIGTKLVPNIKGVQYIHQLQNLYYALTNEELIIKL